MGVKICAEQGYDIEIALSSIAAKMMQHEKNHQPNITDTVNISVLAASSPFPQNLNRNASLLHQVWAKLTAKKTYVPYPDTDG